MRLKTLLYTLCLRRYRAVSFDIFDTLLERDVDRPVDVFLRVGDIVLGAGKGERFQADRIGAEELKTEEVRSELNGCFVKASMKPVFDAALKHGKTVFLISDMYLPPEVISGMAARCGYEGYEKLFVSNEYGVSKRSGKLFGEVLKEYGLSKNDLIHIGDSIGADLLGARKAGIAALPVARKNRLGRLVNRS